MPAVDPFACFSDQPHLLIQEQQEAKLMDLAVLEEAKDKTISDLQVKLDDMSLQLQDKDKKIFALQVG